MEVSFSPSPAGSSSRGGDVTVYVLDINQTSLPIRFYSVFVSVSVFMALSTVFHSINSPDNSPLFQLCSSDLISAQSTTEDYISSFTLDMSHLNCTVKSIRSSR